MLFSSPIFLFLFLPLTLLGYYLCPKTLKNYWLLLTSLVFFAWGGISFTGILIGSIILNYSFGLFIQKHIGQIKAYHWLAAGVTCNLIVLGIFKYVNFFSHSFNLLLERFTAHRIHETNIVLPIGISFYTFHSISYLVDIYKGKTAAQKNIFNLGLYISLFSQLIAGPIIRYSDIGKQLTERTHSLSKFSSGVERFLIGLAKKVLLANTFGRVADVLFNTASVDLGALNAWLGLMCYTMQIYCDFAGYSDMAIGLGRMFGFEFMENFNFPYLAKSIKEFWRRWHISLSSFFKDYVYIPLGGNRVSKNRQYINLITVFFLTGLWHGASLTFIVWGLFHGFFLLLERLFLEKFLEKIWRPVANVYALLIVMFAWVLFRNEQLETTFNYWKALFDFSINDNKINLFISFMNLEFYLASAFALLGTFGFFSFFQAQLNKVLNNKVVSVTYDIGSAFLYTGIIILCSLYLISGTYNPFIYYKF